MTENFAAYLNHWGLSGLYSNIDHRRVPNLEVFFTRVGARLPPSTNEVDYLPGDIVAWNLRGETGGWLPHIGIVSEQRGEVERSNNQRPLIVHNIGAGRPKLEDVLFAWPITGHFRYRPGDGQVAPVD